MSEVSVVKEFFAGGFGGVCLVAAGHPLDTIKVRLQTMPAGAPAYSGALDCARATISKEGFRGLYKGMAAPIVGVTPMYALCFAGFGIGKKLQQTSPDQQLTLFQTFKAGLVAGVFTTPIMTPGERVKCLLQIQAASESGTKKYSGPIDCTKQLYRAGGLSSVYRGFLATFLRDIPASGVYFLTYECLQRNLPFKEHSRAHPIGALRTLTAGGMAGIFNWLSCIVQDTLKSRYQTAPDGKYPQGIRSVFKEIMQKEGPKSLFRGLGPALLRAFPANAACFLGYELAMSFMNWIY